MRKRPWLQSVCVAVVIGGLVALYAATHASGSTLDGTQRCQPVTDGGSFVYNCWSAHPESFALLGWATARYRFGWKVFCGGRWVNGYQYDTRAIKVYVGRFSSDRQAKRAYRLMINSTRPCLIIAGGSPVSGQGSFSGLLYINVNHALPVDTKSG